MLKNDIAEAKESFSFALQLLWSYHGYDKKAPLSEVELDVANYLQHGPRHKIALAFREFGKSHITCQFAVWSLDRDPGLNVIFSSSSQAFCKNLVGLARMVIDTTPWYRHLSPRREARERSGAIEIDVAGHRGKDPSIAAVSVTSQLTGRRGGLVIVDDVETPETSMSKPQRNLLQARVPEYFNVAYKGSGQIIFLGTPQHYESVYEHLIATAVYTVRSWPIEYPDQSDAQIRALAPLLQSHLDAGIAKPGDPTCPHRFSSDDLDVLRRTQGVVRYAMQYQLHLGISERIEFPLHLRDVIVFPCGRTQAPLDITWGQTNHNGSTIQDIASVGMGTDAWYGPAMTSAEWGSYQQSVLWVDPSGGRRDRTAWAVVSGLHGNLYVHAVESFEGAPSTENLMRIVADARLYRVNDVIIEQQFGGEVLSEVLRPLLHQKFNRTEPEDTEIDDNYQGGWACSVSTQRSTGQKEQRIVGILDSLFASHRLVFDPAVCRNERLSQQIVQIQTIPRCLEYDDEIDALAGACSQFTEELHQDSRVQSERVRQERIDKAIRDHWERVGLMEPDPESWIQV